MRPKLMIIASLLAGLVGAALAILVALALDAPASALTAPAAATILACFFVYRHTARRRLLQALLTALGSTLLALLMVYAAHYYLRTRASARSVPESALKLADVATRFDSA